MRTYIGLFFSVLLFFTACSNDGAPADIIKQPQMASLLTQVHLVDGSLYNISQYPDSLYKYGAGKYVALFKRFHTDSVQFKKSYRYYTTKPELFQEIYDEVSKNLKAKSDSLNKIKFKNALP